MSELRAAVRRTPDDVRAIRSHERIAHWAGRHPDKLAIGYDGRWITYAEWHERVQEQAASLRGDVSPVALVYERERGVDFAVSYAATHAAGRPALVLDPRIGTRDLRAQIAFAGAGTVLGHDDLAAADEPRSAPLLDRWGDPIAEISFSSGTTGEPKGILLSHRALAWAGVVAGQLAAGGRNSFDVPGNPLGPDDTLVSAVQAGSAATTNGLLNSGLAVGARMHLLPKFDASPTRGTSTRSGRRWSPPSRGGCPSSRSRGRSAWCVSCRAARWASPSAPSSPPGSPSLNRKTPR